MRCSSIVVQVCALLLVGCSTSGGHRPDVADERIERPAPSPATVDPIADRIQNPAVAPEPATKQATTASKTTKKGSGESQSATPGDTARAKEARGNAPADRYKPLQNASTIPITCANVAGKSVAGKKDDCFELGESGYWQPGGDITAARVYDPAHPTGANNFMSLKRKGRPKTSDLIGVIKALKGDGLPLNAVEKDTDSAVLFRVRSDAMMLMWRNPF